MKYLTDNELFNVFLLCTIIGEFLLPCLLERYYTEYNGKTMVMSALGSSQSPVRLIYNLWLIWLGSFLHSPPLYTLRKQELNFLFCQLCYRFRLESLPLVQGLFLDFSA